MGQSKIITCTVTCGLLNTMVSINNRVDKSAFFTGNLGNLVFAF